MDKRIGWIDSFRAIMIFCIVLGHTFQAGLIRQYVYSFHVASFFFISGYLFCRKPNDTFVQFFCKKSFALMLPYYLFSILSILIFLLLGQFASQRLSVAIRTSDVELNVWGMLYANGATGLMKWNLPLWFIPCLFITLIVMYPFAMLVSCGGRERRIAVCSVAMVLAFCFNFLNYYFFHLEMLPFGFENTLYLMPFFMLGYDCRLIFERNINLLKCKYHLPVGCAALVAGFVLGTWCHVPVDYVSTSYGDLGMFYLSAILSIIGYACICQVVPMPCLYYVGRNTMPILLMHKFPVVFLQIILGNIIGNSFIGICAACIIAIVACCLSLGAGAIIKRYVPFVLGIKGNSKP